MASFLWPLSQVSAAMTDPPRLNSSVADSDRPSAVIVIHALTVTQWLVYL